MFAFLTVNAEVIDSVHHLDGAEEKTFAVTIKKHSVVL